MVSNSVIVRFCGLRLGYANDPAGKTTTGVPGRLGFQIIGFFVDDDCMILRFPLSRRSFSSP